MKKVHPMGAYVLPMPEGYNVKKEIYRQIRKLGVEVSNRLTATRLLTAEGRIAGVMALDSRMGDFVVVRA